MRFSDASSTAGYVNPDRVLLWENTRKEVREALQSGRLKAAFVPAGSTEQHGENLALGTDFFMATFLSQQAALQMYPQVIVSTPCPVGYAPYHMGRKGTLTLRRETFQAFVFDVIESLRAHGIRTILVVNGHGGNQGPLQDAFPEWREELGITLDFLEVSQAYTEEDLLEHIQSYREAKAGTLSDVEQSALSHASEMETSRMIAAFPGMVRRVTMKEYDEAGLDYESDLSPDVRQFYERHYGEGQWRKGVAGENNARDRARQQQALLATAEKGEAMVTLSTSFIVDRMRQMIEATESGLPWTGRG